MWHGLVPTSQANVFSFLFKIFSYFSSEKIFHLQFLASFFSDWFHTTVTVCCSAGHWLLVTVFVLNREPLFST